uniref:Cna B domain protein n=1 Tax=Solibacter usitatus (strain Ellin6076) TaxID=234267 RepID=Q026X8_SOLUE
MQRNSLCRFALFTALAAIAAAPGFSQAFYGSVVGTVTDPSGGALTGAAVTLTNAGTGERRQTLSGSGGDYQFLNLVPGTYRVQVERTGFKRAAHENLEVNISGTVRADISLQLGDVTQTVEVQAAAPLLRTEDANLSQVVSSRAVEDLPVNGRNILNLTALVPGVVPQGTTDGNAITGKNIFAAGNYQIGGGAANQGAVYYDGVPANSALGNLVNMVPSPDAIAEFRVQTNSNNAEFGRYAGGVVNISSRSGSNQYHGSAYEYFRNDVLNATNFFANANNTGKPAFKQNQYGLNGGGPIKKNKIFFFAGWEAFRGREGSPFIGTVPLPEMYNGDFSNFRNASNAIIPIYDPLTQCGTGANGACAAGQTIQRQVFPGNIIPKSRFDPVGYALAAFPLVALPNQPGDAFTHNNNYSALASKGGDNDQVNGRLDYNVSEKLRLFGRFSRWHSTNLPFAPFHNGIYANDPYAPEEFTTTQGVLGGTYLITPTLVLDLRASYIRFPYIRSQSYENISLSKTFGFPQYMDEQLPIIHSGPGTSIPSVGIGGYTTASGLHILSTENDYLLTPNLSWVRGKHTLKFGADWRDMQNGYYQTFDGGTFTFTTALTCQNALNCGASGNGFASMLLGFGSSGTETAFSRPWESLHYQGYYAQDVWQATPRLTVTAGIRWEIPGVWRERYNRLASFNPSELNPALKGKTVNGQPIYGALDFPGDPNHAFNGWRNEHFRLFAPRVGIAYRLNDKTVIRTGGGIYYLPSTTGFSEAPWGLSINQLGNPWLATLDSGVTPYYPLSNPFPNGFTPAPANLPRDQAQLLMVGTSLGNIPLGSVPYPYQSQWNFSVQRQFWGGVAVDAAYAGSRGVHLPRGNQNFDALPTTYLSMGTGLNTQVANPFYGLVKTGTLSQPTVQQGQLLLPYPEYTGVSEGGGYVGNSSYHALQMKVERRFSHGGTVLAAYTFSKLLGDVASRTGWLDSGVGAAPGAQNPYNLRAEKSLAGFDSRQRLALSYAVDLPIGKDQKFLNGGNGAVQKFTSGWSVSGTSTFQLGYPLALTASPNVTGFGYGLRPNVTPGCNPKLDGPAQSRLNGWFNFSCFTVPAAYALGSESATDPVLRGPGINNFNVSLLKKTTVTERLKLEFRGEAYNLFNRVQFGPPNTGITTAANPTTGQIRSQINNPRLLQFALKLLF